MRTSLFPRLALASFAALIGACEGHTEALSGIAEGSIVLYVAPGGNDAWSGALPAPSADASDGPLATLPAARDRVRTLKDGARALYVVLRGGTYRLAEPLRFGPEDSGALQAPIRYMAYPGETPVVSGGRVLEGLEESGGRWSVDLPEVAAGTLDFYHLWANGARRTLARTPNADFYHTAGKVPEWTNPDSGAKEDLQSLGFRYAEGNLEGWDDLSEAVVVAIHSWDTTHSRVAYLDEANHIVKFRQAVGWAFEYWGPEQRYYVENIASALDAPGEWLLDRKTGRFTYLPYPGESIENTELVVPVVDRLLSVEGEPGGAAVEHLHFDGIAFRHQNQGVPEEGHSNAQAAWPIGAAVEFRYARNCSLANGEIAHTGGHGLWLREGCTGCVVRRNELHDIGGGGIHVGSVAQPANGTPTSDGVATRVWVDNNYVHGGGQMFRGGVGIWVGHANYVTVSHNEIADQYYSGISNGWNWGYSEHPAHHNLFEFNHIHHLGKGVMSDMGGIYTLGPQVGTTMRYNVIHDVWSHHYGGWGLYTDEGSSEVTMEYNVVWNVTDGAFHQHYGKNNRIRNNILTFSRGHWVKVSRKEEHRSFVFERNLLIGAHGDVFPENWGQHADLDSDYNLYWCTSDAALNFGGLTFAEWQARGKDAHALIADPLFADLAAHDYRLRDGSPAYAIGFEPIDTARVGLQGDKEWVDKPKALHFDGWPE